MKKTVQRGRQSGALTSKVVELIEQQIATGALKPGNYVISERELCKLLQVSRVTVRRGFEVLVKEGLLHREPNRGYLYRGENYSMKTIGSAVIFMHEATEGVLSSDPMLSQIWKGARLEAEEHGLVTMIHPGVGGLVTREFAHKLAGVSKAVITDIADLASFQYLQEAGIEVVGINYLVDLPIDNVVSDNYGGIRKAVGYLYEQGCRKIGFLSTLEALSRINRDYHSRSRLSAYFGSLHCLKCDPLKKWVQEVGFGSEVDVQSILKLLKEPIDGLVIPDESLYPFVKEALRKTGRRDVQLVLCGEPDEPVFEGGCLPAFIRWDLAAMGREGVRRLLFRMANPEAKTLIIEIPSRLHTPDGRVPK